MDVHALLPPGAREERRGETLFYRGDLPGGAGTLELLPLLPGVLLTFRHLQAGCALAGEGPRPGLLRLDHCLTGGWEWTLEGGEALPLGPRDMTLLDLSRPPEGRCPGGEFYGLSLTLDPAEAAAGLGDLLGSGTPDLAPALDRLLAGRAGAALRGEPRAQHTASQLYDAPPAIRLPFLRLKAAELLLLLSQRGEGHLPRRSVAWKLQEIAREMTRDLGARVPLEELARQNHISVATLKKQFRQVYGEPPYTYLKRRRMEEAARLLQATALSIRDIALAVGYQNPSKFSAAFTQHYGLPPTQYRGRPETLPDEKTRAGGA